MRPQTAKAAQSHFDTYVTTQSSGLLTADEEAGLTACLPKLVKLAEDMGVLATPVADWSREEMMRFLTLAIRAAVPLRYIHHGNADLNDRLPF